MSNGVKGFIWIVVAVVLLFISDLRVATDAIPFYSSLIIANIWFASSVVTDE